MTVRPHDAGCTTDEYFFVNRAAQLTAFACHVVYPYLCTGFSHQEQAIKNKYGGHVPVVPMTKIAVRPPGHEAYEKGIKSSGRWSFAASKLQRHRKRSFMPNSSATA